MKCFKDVEGKIPCTQDGDLVARLEPAGIELIEKYLKRKPPFGPLFNPEIPTEVAGE